MTDDTMRMSTTLHMDGGSAQPPLVVDSVSIMQAEELSEIEVTSSKQHFIIANLHQNRGDYDFAVMNITAQLIEKLKSALESLEEDSPEDINEERFYDITAMVEGTAETPRWFPGWMSEAHERCLTESFQIAEYRGENFAMPDKPRSHVVILEKDDREKVVRLALEKFNFIRKFGFVPSKDKPRVLFL